ncbi:MAG: Asp-tRNA(Asn)/Glu-tRNA(Gln) amidotransferase GatCAB subunit B, partial [Endomicrobium sp.]|nr:Asp-tRNA(Asn)/Glu-tRNA(Gln) amidotransferase GatCAB subunit B [Endomicrobium sp.]
LLANWISTELANKLHVAKLDINKSPISSEHLSKLIDNIIVGKISWKIAKQIFDEMFKTSIDPEILIAKMNISQISDMTIITQLCDEAIQEKYQATVEVKSGNIKAIDAIIGTVIRKSNGRENPKLVNDFITKKLHVKK